MYQRKPIKGFEGLYEIDTNGNVYSLPKTWTCGNGAVRKSGTTLRKQHTDPKGYLYVGLHKNGVKSTFSVHRLVAMHFLKSEAGLTDVNHKDGVKNNNNYKNLEWVTKSENMKHAYKIGLKKPRRKISSKQLETIY